MLSDPKAVVDDPAAAERWRIAGAVYWMENLLAPQEFMSEMALLEAAGDAGLVAALTASVTAVDLGPQADLRRFRSERLGDSAVLFRGDRRGPARNLLVLFAGERLRPMLPIPIFLQRMPEAGWDVLFVIDRQKQHYRFGAGPWPTFGDLAGWILSVADDYARVVTIGTSMGATAAVRLALIAPAIRAIAVAARPVSDLSRMLQHEPLPSAFEPVCACLPKGGRDILYLHGRDHADDGRWSRAFADLTGGVAVAVAGGVRHGVVTELWRTGRLEPFLKAALSDVPTPALRDLLQGDLEAVQTA